jgi:hypothetical protein
MPPPGFRSEASHKSCAKRIAASCGSRIRWPDGVICAFTLRVALALTHHYPYGPVGLVLGNE